MSVIDKLRAEMRRHSAAAKELEPQLINADGEYVKEVADQINGHLGKIDEIKAQINTIGRLNDLNTRDADAAAAKAADVSWRTAGPNEGSEPVDEKSWDEFEIKTAAVHPEFGVIPATKKIRFYMPRRVIDAGKDYPSAFEAYLRKGKASLGPSDVKTLRLAVDSSGGFLAPAEYQRELIRKIAASAVVRQYARVIQASGSMISWPKIVYTTDDKYTSGVRMTWTGETPEASTSHRVTDPVIGLYNIPVHTAMASLPISMDLIEDAAFDVLSYSADVLGEAYALGENDAFWNGNGSGRPRGILTDAAAGTGFAVTAAGTAQAIAADEVIDLIYDLPAQYERNAKLFMTKSTEGYLRKLTDTNGSYLWPVLPQVGAFGPAPREILGFPTIRDEFLDEIATASSGTTYPLVFADLSSYVVVDRVGLSLQRLDQKYAEENLTVLLARKRVGGQLTQNWRGKILSTLQST